MSIEAIRDALAGFDEVIFATLFGSRAAGRSRPDSDWDIAVFLDERLDKHERFRVHREIVAALAPAIDCDVVVLNDAPILLAHRAIRGQSILERSREAWVRFVVPTLSRSMDEQYWRDFFAEETRKRAAQADHG